jgi:hypothetical protein
VKGNSLVSQLPNRRHESMMAGRWSLRLCLLPTTTNSNCGPAIYHHIPVTMSVVRYFDAFSIVWPRRRLNKSHFDGTYLKIIADHSIILAVRLARNFLASKRLESLMSSNVCTIHPSSDLQANPLILRRISPRCLMNSNRKSFPDKRYFRAIGHDGGPCLSLEVTKSAL